MNERSRADWASDSDAGEANRLPVLPAQGKVVAEDRSTVRAMFATILECAVRKLNAIEELEKLRFWPSEKIGDERITLTLDGVVYETFELIKAFPVEADNERVAPMLRSTLPKILDLIKLFPVNDDESLKDLMRPGAVGGQSTYKRSKAGAKALHTAKRYLVKAAREARVVRSALSRPSTEKVAAPAR